MIKDYWISHLARTIVDLMAQSEDELSYKCECKEHANPLLAKYHYQWSEGGTYTHASKEDATLKADGDSKQLHDGMLMLASSASGSGQQLSVKAEPPGLSDLQHDHVVLTDGKRALEKQLLIGKDLESKLEFKARHDPALASKLEIVKQAGTCKSL